MNTDIPDLIAGALGVSRGTAYDMMREALAEAPPEVCCGSYANCLKPCTPRGEWMASRPPAQPAREPLTFEEWLAKQHGDPEEIGFLQALRIAYIAGQDSITKGNT